MVDAVRIGLGAREAEVLDRSAAPTGTTNRPMTPTVAANKMNLDLAITRIPDLIVVTDGK